MKSLWTVLLTGAFVSGCVSSWQKQVTEANARWERAICRSPRYYEIEVVPNLICNGVKAYGCHGSGLIEVSAEVANDPVKLRHVLLHEMGHSIAPGAPHVEPGTGTMTEGYTDALHHITAADIATICKEYDCPCHRPERP